jgi:hypothetical protein
VSQTSGLYRRRVWKCFGGKATGNKKGAPPLPCRHACRLAELPFVCSQGKYLMKFILQKNFRLPEIFSSEAGEGLS